VRAPADDRMKSRKSFTIYLYTDTRPAAETAPSHGTVYVQGGLPKAFKPGVTVTQELYDDIKSNLERRHSYLRQLYKREYKYENLVDDLTRNLAEWKRASNVPVNGFAITREVHETRYPDGWMGARFKCEVEITAKTKHVTLHGYCPEAFSDGRPVTLSVDGATVSKTVKPGGFEIGLPVNLSHGRVVLEITSHAQRIPTAPSDLREVSIIVDRVSFA